MVNFADIQKVARRLGDAAQAESVILFGSYARGNSTQNSDVDFLVIAPSKLPRFKRSRELYQLFKPYFFGMDILVYTPEEVKQDSSNPLSFVASIIKEGKVVYAQGI
ncbi:MAG: hypothetical protein AMJ79_10325 [Phycisphaerae bacterium SM23_30]|nr:MAG: hypothetical protein AMJ79_10325 [Phycisphaerae bacterium SM23_30]